MIYIIISNVGMAIMMVVLYFRYSCFRLTSSAEIRNLKTLNEKNIAERNIFEAKFVQATAEESSKIEKFLREIDTVRQDKEVEIRLRLEAEKAAELSLQRVEEISKRMGDWRLVQDAMMQDAKEVMFQVGDEIYNKVNNSYKKESAANKNIFNQLHQTISNSFVKLFEIERQKSPESVVKSVATPANTGIVGLAKKLTADLVATIKTAGHVANKDYFLPANFDAVKAKLLLCDVGFVSEERLYIIDFKACNYFEEYNKAANKAEALVVLKQRLDKYFTYLKNPKYYDSIVKVISSTKEKFVEAYVIIVVPSKLDLKLVQEINYYEKAHKDSLDIVDFDEINNMVL